MYTLKETCSFLKKKSNTEHKKCLNAFQCRFNKCEQEVNNYNASILTPTETSACFDEKVKDYSKCIENKKKEKGTTEKMNAMENCVSSNCSHEKDYKEYLQKIMAKELVELSRKINSKKIKKVKKTNKKNFNKSVRNIRTKSK